MRRGFQCATFFFAASISNFAGDAVSPERTSQFLGANACASSGCHGGGGHEQNQFLVWSLRDFHHERPFATLTTARSKQIAAAAQIKNPTEDRQCVACHAPLREVPEHARGPMFRVSEGVSCESCHGPAENWLRSHTRHDLSHADRVEAGLRDLKNLYVRANTCVACHQNVSLPLLKAGHPELIFELDGQSVSQPKHWRENPTAKGAQTWLVGQAAALRELSWQLETSGGGDSNLVARAEALVWIFQKIENVPGLPKWSVARANDSSTRVAADKIAREASELQWTPEISAGILKSLSTVSADFRQAGATREQQARRAERLVLALDRVAGVSDNPALEKLFKLAQSIPDFDPTEFSAALDAFNAQAKVPGG